MFPCGKRLCPKRPCQAQIRFIYAVIEKGPLTRTPDKLFQILTNCFIEEGVNLSIEEILTHPWWLSSATSVEGHLVTISAKLF